MFRDERTFCIALFLSLMAVQASAVPVGIGYTVTPVATPPLATGDVVVVGDAVFVGTGTFGSQSLVRVDSSGTTILATGFASLGGMSYDAANDRLFFGDNGLELSSSGSGDTLYALDGALTSAGGFSAPDLEVLASGSIVSFADVTLDPGDATGTTLFVSDATGPPGSVLRVDADLGSILAVQSVAPFAAGLAATSTTLFIGTSDFPPEGSVFTAPLPGGAGPLDTLATGLPGQFDLEVASDGTLLSTSQDQLLRLDPTTGAVLEVIATGFGFAGGLFESDGIVFAIDSDFAAGTSTVYAFEVVPEPSTGALLALGLAGLATRPRQGSRSCSRRWPARS